MKSIPRFLLYSFVSVSLVLGHALVFSSIGETAFASSPIEEGLGKVKNEFPTTGKLSRSENVGELIINIIQLLLTITMAVAILFIIIGGFQYITSAGSDDKAKSGKKTLTNALIGLVLIIMAYVIVSVVNRTLTR